MKGLIGLTAAGMAALMVGACAPRLETHGNLPDPEKLADIRPGEISRNEVEEILGSPSSIAAFDKETWFYVSERTETTAFFRPDVLERQVLVLHFDEQGILQDIEAKGLADGRKIKPVERETPTAGTEMSVIQQLLGNLGRFNKSNQ